MEPSRYATRTGHESTHIRTISQIVQLSPSRRPTTILVLDPSPGSGSDTPKTPGGQADGENPTPYSVTSVAWAPSCGRSYHLIATGSRDGHVRIWRVKPPSPADDNDDDADSEEDSWGA